MDEIENENNQEINQTTNYSTNKSDSIGTPNSTETIEPNKKTTKSKIKAEQKEDTIIQSPIKIVSTPEAQIKDSKNKIYNFSF